MTKEQNEILKISKPNNFNINKKPNQKKRITNDSLEDKSTSNSFENAQEKINTSNNTHADNAFEAHEDSSQKRNVETGVRSRIIKKINTSFVPKKTHNNESKKIQNDSDHSEESSGVRITLKELKQKSPEELQAQAELLGI